MASAQGVVGGVVAWFADSGNWTGPAGVPALLVEHLAYSAAALGLACAVALPLGVWLGHTGRGGVLAIQVSNVGRAVPTLAVLVILVLLGVSVGAPFGRTTFALLLALVLFAVPPLLTNAYVGVREVDAGAVDAARGTGMSDAQVLWRVELPLATPLLMNGVRQAAVQVVATVSIAAIAAFGGLGRIITGARGDAGGLDLAQILAGSLLVAALAIVVDVGFARLGTRVDPVARARRRSRPRIVAPSGRPGPRRVAAGRVD